MATKGTFLTILNAATANGKGQSQSIDGYEKLILQVATAPSAGPTATAATIKVYGSSSAAEPDWDSAGAPGNILAPKLLYDLDDGSVVAGSTGIVLASAEVCKEYKINVDGMRWINVIVSGYTAGQITAILRALTLSPA